MRTDSNLTAPDALDVIETEIAVLARALERLQRRSEIYRDLDRSSYLIARKLETNGPVSINGLAAVLGVDGTTVTRQVAAMEKARLVVRRVDPDDRRVSRISLSSAAYRRCRAVQRARRERIATILDNWTENDRRQFGQLLARFNAELNRDTEGNG